MGPLLLLTSSALTAARNNGWSNSTSGVHTFGLWSFHEKGADLSAFDFVWSLEFADLPVFRPSMPNAVLSRYVAFSLAPTQGQNLSWWQEHHPEWVLYQCDRKTPAAYWGTTIPLDVTNPDVLAWQLGGTDNPDSVEAIVAAGFDSISLDVFGWGNYGKACGVYNSAGKWKQLYSGDVDTDPKYAAGVNRWLKAFYTALRKRVLFIINFSSNPGAEPTCPSCLPTSLAWDAERTLFVGNHSDGALSESGFTNFGSNVTTGDAWENRLQFMRHMQRAGKYYADTSYWGPLNVQSKQKIDPERWDAVLDYIIGSWMLGNEGLSSVFLGPNDCAAPYLEPNGDCVFPGWKGNMQNYSQFSAPIGTPLGAAEKGGKGAGCGSIWHREYTAAVVFLNPTPANQSCMVELDTSTWQYSRLDGTAVRQATATVDSASAVVLLRAPKAPQ